MSKWMEYLNSTSEIKYNVAHIQSMDELTSNQVARYVSRCIAIAEKDTRHMEAKYKNLIIRTLQWMDVSKCGSELDRDAWKKQCPNICLDIHNEASAEIYMQNCDDDEWTKQIVYILIKTHGLIGQYIMGETTLDASSLINDINMEKAHLIKVMRALNHAIVEVGFISDGYFDFGFIVG